MNQLRAIICLFFSLFAMPLYSNAGEPVHHDIKVIVDPGRHKIRVKDTLTVDDTLLPNVRFHLHKGLQPSSSTEGVHIKQILSSIENGVADSFEVSLPKGENTFVLEYEGVIYHELESYGKEYARGFRNSPGLISEEGVYLSGNSYWYPHLEGKSITFSTHIILPSSWNAVSQGSRVYQDTKDGSTAVTWESKELQEEIFIVAGQFIEYYRTAGQLEIMVFLRKPDEALADKYLDAAAQYIEMYGKLIGPYPYTKFAVVENFWETGFGMPSFTLLGARILRFPFILTTSFPHEILHNWWGNSVYSNYETGNWSEGLTAYLSDHLIKEQEENSIEYRQTTLQKYVDYVISGKDFPLTEFRSRDSSSSEAVGYGKSLMFFHMMRQELGDELFIRCLQNFYRNHIFKTSSFRDIRASFEEVSEKNLKIFFDQWIKRSGAPQLKIRTIEVRTKDVRETKDEGKGYVLTALIEQVQPEGLYSLKVPVAVTMEGREEAYQTTIHMQERTLKIRLDLPDRPVRMDVDPEFDLFRRLDREEIPAALSQAFGSERLLILLPSSVENRMAKGYLELAEALRKSGPGEIEIKYDEKIRSFPSHRSAVVIGWENKFVDDFISSLYGYDLEIGETFVRIGSTTIQKKGHSFVLVARHPWNRDLSLTWIATDDIKAIPGLGKKLPHYHKYSYLAFEGDEPSNVAKGRWPVKNSPMTVFIPAADRAIEMAEMGKLKPRRPLAALLPGFSEERMLNTIRFLASVELEGRGFGSNGLHRAAEFIAGKFRESGLVPAGDEKGGYFQSWTEVGGDPEKEARMKNVVGLIYGNNPDITQPCVVIGAHYDHLGRGWPDSRNESRGKIYPGADDNASGIAVLIEVARELSNDLIPERTIIFVAFTGEESGKRGSRYFATHPAKYYIPSECIGMINLDTVGRLGDRKLMVIGAGSAREWEHILRGAGYVTGIDTETVIEELDSSDQISFHEAGVSAIQLFSGPHVDYHRPSDTVDKIDPGGLIKVASLTKEVIEYLAGRQEPLTGTLKNEAIKVSRTVPERKVSLGTIPDFAFKGKGCRITGVVPGSPAESCGLQGGDILMKINGIHINSLRDLANILKSLKDGDKVTITYVRNGKTVTSEVAVTLR